MGGGEGQEGGERKGQLTCGHPLPLAPTNPPDDIIAHQRVLALLQASHIFMRHKSLMQLWPKKKCLSLGPMHFSV